MVVAGIMFLELLEQLSSGNAFQLLQRARPVEAENIGRRCSPLLFAFERPRSTGPYAEARVALHYPSVKQAICLL